MIAIALFALFALTLARVPNALFLSCDEQERAYRWLQGAHDSGLLVDQTLFGGFDCHGNQVNGCYEAGPLMDATTCITPHSDDQCPNGCDLVGQIVLDDPCCDVEAIETGEESHLQDGAVCRTNRRWIAIGMNKLYAADDAFDAANYTEAIKLACAAETILSTVLAQLGGWFSDDGITGATYKHQISPKQRVVFPPTENANHLEVVVRTIQSFRDCTTSVCKNHTLIATYSYFALELDGPLGSGTFQLLWPISGSISAFHRTGLPYNAPCVLAQTPTNHVPQTDPSLRLPTLGHLDFARVVSGFTRCDGFPRNGCIKDFSDLSADRCCNTLPLVKDIDAAHNLLAHDIDPHVFAFVFIGHFMSTVEFDSAITHTVRPDEDLLIRYAACQSSSDAACWRIEMPRRRQIRPTLHWT